MDRIGLLQTSQRVIVAKAERRHAPLAFILAELKWLQWKRGHAVDQIPLARRRYEFGGVTQALGNGGFVSKQWKLLGQAGGPFVQLTGRISYKAK